MLQFNTCRWKVDGADVEVVRGVVADHRLALINGQLWRRCELHLPPLHGLVQLVVKEGRATSEGLERFILLRLDREGNQWWLTIGSDR